MFVAQDLNFATLATVSRCGMVWFSEDVLSLDMIFEHYISEGSVSHINCVWPVFLTYS